MIATYEIWKKNVNFEAGTTISGNPRSWTVKHQL